MPTNISPSGQTAAQVQTLIGITNVLSNGVTGDGATDDSDAIQALLDTGGKIYFPEPPGGFYRLTKTLTIIDNGAIMLGPKFGNSSGSVASMLKWDAAFNGVCINILYPTANSGINIYGVTIEDLSIRAQGTGNTGIQITRGYSIFINRCRILGADTGNGVSILFGAGIDYTTDTSITDSFISNWNTNILSDGVRSTYAKIENNFIVNAVTGVNGIFDGVISGNDFEALTTGILVTGSGSFPKIIANRFEAIGTNSIIAQDGTIPFISGNYYADGTLLLQGSAATGALVLNEGDARIPGSVNIPATAVYKINGAAIVSAQTALSNYFSNGGGNLTMTGTDNNTSGFYSGLSNTTGTGNNFNGSRSGQNNSTGSYNNFSGIQSGFSNTTGASNNFIGAFAGYSNVTGFSNNFIGFYAGYYATGSNELYIDNLNRGSTAGDKAGAMLYGTFDATPANQTLAINAKTTVGVGGVQAKNIRHGITDAMTAGVVTVTDTGCTANTRYFFTVHTIGTVAIPSTYYATTRTASTSFVVTASVLTDTSTLDWMAIEP